MINNIIASIINKFITNKIDIYDSGLFTLDKEKSDINMNSNSNTCTKIIENTLKELNYLAKDKQLSRDILYKLIIDIENISHESIILFMSYFSTIKSDDETVDFKDINKLNQLLINKFSTNDINIFQGILAQIFIINQHMKKNFGDNKHATDIENLLKILLEFKSMLVFLSNTPFEKDLTVGIYQDTVDEMIDEGLDRIKSYKIKEITNSILLMKRKKKYKTGDECYPSFYENPGPNPLRHTQPAKVILKAGWDRIIMPQIPLNGIIKTPIRLFYNTLMKLVGKEKDAEVVYFKNENMCQRRWRNFSIIDVEADDASWEEEEYIDLGENIYNLYDPDVNEHTDPESNLYKNNEILKKIWFYEDDIFPIEPNKNAKYNIPNYRNEFAFKTLNTKLDNKDIFKSSIFSKNDLPYIISILWLYKIYDEYTSIVEINDTEKKNDNLSVLNHFESVEETLHYLSDPDSLIKKSEHLIDDLSNINMFINYFKPSDLLIYYKRYILIENNSFDNETLAFFVIYGALSHVSSFIVDKNVIVNNYQDFKPNNYNLFQNEKVNSDITKLINQYQLHHTKNIYLNFLKNEIPKVLSSETLINKITEEYENKYYERKKQYIHTGLTLLSLFSQTLAFSKDFTKMMNIPNGYYKEEYNEFENNFDKNYTTNQLAKIDRTIETIVPSYVLNSVKDQTVSISISNPDLLSSLAVMDNNIPITITPAQVDLILAQNLTNVILGTQVVKGLSVSAAREVIDLLNIKNKIRMSFAGSKSDQQQIPSKINEGKVNSDSQLISLFQRFHENNLKSPMTNLQIVSTLEQIGYKHKLDREISDIESKISLESDPSIKKDLEKKLKEKNTEKKNVGKKIADLNLKLKQVPKVQGVKSIKTIVNIHGYHDTLTKGVVTNCEDFKYIGMLGDPGKVSVVNNRSTFNQQAFDNMPDPSNLEKPANNLCVMPDLNLLVKNGSLDNDKAGIFVEITYDDGHVEQKQLINNQQYIKIFSPNHQDLSQKASLTGLHISSFVSFLKSVFLLNGLDTSKSSLVFTSCRGTPGGLVKAGGNIRKNLVVNFKICEVNFEPVLPSDFIPNDIKRIAPSKTITDGTIIDIDKPVIFDIDNPKRFAGDQVRIVFFDDKEPDKCPDPMLDMSGSMFISYTLLIEFNKYLSNRPDDLKLFNSLNAREKQDFIKKVIFSINPILDELINYRQNTPEQQKFEKELSKIFNNFFFPHTDYKQLKLENKFGCSDPNLGCRVDLSKFFRSLAKERNDKSVKKQKGGDGIFHYTEEELSFFNDKFNTFRISINYFNTHEIILDEFILSKIQKLDISNTLKSLKIIIEKIKIQINIKRKKNLTHRSEFNTYLYTYFYEIIYWNLLSELNKYKSELDILVDSIDNGKTYKRLFGKKFIGNSIIEYKKDIEKSIVKEPNIDDIPNKDNFYNDMIIKRWYYYIYIYDISIFACDFKNEIEKIEFGLIMNQSNNTNIFEPLSLIIPNYKELVEQNYTKYFEELEKLYSRDISENIDNNFLIIYYNNIHNKIQDIQNNIFEIRRINIDIIENIVKVLTHPVELNAKNNISSYTEHLSFYLDNHNEIYNYMTDKTDIQSSKEIVVEQSKMSVLFSKLKFWNSQNKPNTIENKLNEIYSDFLIDYNKVKMFKTIEFLIT